MLVEHLGKIADKENVAVEPEALALIARAAEGSVRDSLSLLDQAIAHAAGAVRADHVRQMLGLADRARVVDLFDALLRGDIAAALTELRDQYESGADPAVILTDLAEFTHFVTRVKIVPSVADDLSLAEAERMRGRTFAAALSMRVLSRTWQMLLKGIAEVQAAGRPVAAAEMVLVRIAYAADLPTPDEVVRSLGNGSAQRLRGRKTNGGGGAMPNSTGAGERAALRRAARSAAGRGVAGDESGRALADSAPEPRLCASAPSRNWSRSRPRSAICKSRHRSNAMCGSCIARTASSKSRSNRAPTRRWSMSCRASSRAGPAANGW